MGAGISGTNRNGSFLSSETVEQITRNQGTAVKNNVEVPPDFIHMAGTENRASYTIHMNWVTTGTNAASVDDGVRAQQVKAYKSAMRKWIGQQKNVHSKNAEKLYEKEKAAAIKSGLSPRMVQKRASDARDAYMAKAFAKAMRAAGATGVTITSRHKAFRM